MRALRLAISFLTIFPVYGNRVADEKEMARSLFFYPATGILIGSLLALVSFGGWRLSLGWAGDALVIVLWIIISGGLHLDGLMDTGDGLFSGRERERKLEIMKDSRVGAMGVLALISVVLLKWSFLTILPHPQKYGLLILAAALGRTMMLLPISYFPYARQVPGLGKAFGDYASKSIFPISLIFLAGMGYLAIGALTAACLIVTVLLSVLITVVISRILHGHTGDTYGAVCEVSETIFIVIAAIGLHI